MEFDVTSKNCSYLQFFLLLCQYWCADLHFGKASYTRLTGKSKTLPVCEQIVLKYVQKLILSALSVMHVVALKDVIF